MKNLFILPEETEEEQIAGKTKKQLLSSLLIVISLGVVINGVFGIIAKPDMGEILLITASLCFLGMCYIINRNGYNLLAAFLAIGALTATIGFFSFFQQTPGTLYIFAIPLLLGAIYFEFRALTVYAVLVNIIVITFVITFYDNSEEILRPLGFMFVFSVLIVIMIRNRDKKDAEGQEKMEKTLDASIFALAYQAELRDHSTGFHLERTKIYTRIIADDLTNYPEYKDYLTEAYITDLEKASLLHDIGKVGISDAILLKQGALTDEEFGKMKKHTFYGAMIIEKARKKVPFQTFFSIAYQIALHHHEKWDGSGYPSGKMGSEIPLSARIMALADVYDALRSSRAYKGPFDHETCVQIITSERGKHFDPHIVDSFIRKKDLFEEISKKIFAPVKNI